MTTVKGDDLMDKCKSQTVALFLMGRIALIKLVENPGLDIRWDTDTGILHTDRQPFLIHGGFDGNLASGRRKLDGIVDQVAPDMGGQFLIAVPCDFIKLRFKDQIFCRPGGLSP